MITPNNDGCPHGFLQGTGCWKCERAEMQSQLTAALARVAELEKDCLNNIEAHAKLSYQKNSEIDSLTRQLSESQAKLEKQRLILVANQKIMDGAGDSIRALQAQLTSAREALERCISERHFPGDVMEIAEDALRHLAETPAGGETELAASPETEGLEPFTPVTPPRFGTLATSWGEECTVKVYGSLDDGKVALFNYTTDGRLVTGAMAPMESIEFDSPLPPPPQGKETRE